MMRKGAWSDGQYCNWILRSCEDTASQALLLTVHKLRSALFSYSLFSSFADIAQGL